MNLTILSDPCHPESLAKSLIVADILVSAFVFQVVVLSAMNVDVVDLLGLSVAQDYVYFEAEHVLVLLHVPGFREFVLTQHSLQSLSYTFLQTPGDSWLSLEHGFAFLEER